MERYMGWRPGEESDGARGMYFYLTKLRTDTDHGGPFVYRSADTDMLGWVCERAAGGRDPEKLADALAQAEKALIAALSN